MTRLAFVAALLLALAQTPAPPMPPEGNPGHQEPAPGAFCAHNDPNPAHACSCQRECVPSEDADGKQTIEVKEDAKCRAFCFKDHCHCPAKNCE